MWQTKAPAPAATTNTAHPLVPGMVGARSRRAELSGEQLIALIIILVTAVVVIVIVLKLKGVISGEANGECAAAVARANQINIIYGRSHAVDIKGCQTQQLTLRRDQFSTDDAKAREQVAHALAENMRLCWSAWGSGKYDLFNRTGSYCHVCSIISFDSSAQQLFPSGHIDSFSTYLASTDSPVRDEATGKPLSYKRVLEGYASPDSSVDGSGLDAAPYHVSVQNPQAIIFWYAKAKSQNDVLNLLLGDDVSPEKKTAIASSIAAVAGVATGVGAGAGIADALAVSSTFAGSSLLYYGYERWGGADDYYTLSATYLMPHDANSYYAQSCEHAASSPQSP
jgi:hypothetical protein